ncbi:nuclear transport factor 2 family protein [Thermodesulfobacteriota bacterium]
MTDELMRELRDSADITMITQCVLRERESRDTGNWDQMRDCYHPDSLVRVSWFNGTGPDFVEGSRDMAKRGAHAKHRLSPVLVTLAGDRAIATLLAIIDIPTVIDSVELTLSAYSRFVYRVERRDGVWRIYGFDCIYIRDELTPAILGQTMAIDLGEIKSFRTSYRNLAYYHHLRGHRIDPDLPGEDRPETVARLMREVNGWLGIG